MELLGSNEGVTDLRDEIIEKVNAFASTKSARSTKNRRNYKLTINDLRCQLSKLNEELSINEEEED